MPPEVILTSNSEAVIPEGELGKNEIRISVSQSWMCPQLGTVLWTTTSCQCMCSKAEAIPDQHHSHNRYAVSVTDTALIKKKNL